MTNIAKAARLLLLFAVLATASCLPGPAPEGPEPDYLSLADDRREAFVDAFLEGRWCEAEGLLELSTDNYLQMDLFCEAAYNMLLGWRLKKYVDISDPELLSRAREYRALGMGCPESEKLVFPEGRQDAPGKDRTYRRMLDEGDFDKVKAELSREENPIYASVYARKAAEAALEAEKESIAEELVELARSVDSRQGWVVFLRQDWLLKAAMTESPQERQTIRERIEYLDALIRPCE